ncbi:MAG TPA: hypothetical protein VM597_15640 [Gemmataceae bacterium]|nr:hypothetical protein [Gemmataceae bacterium]
MSRLLIVLCLTPLAAVAAPAPKAKSAPYYHPTREGDTQVYETRTGDSATEYTMVVKKVETVDGRLRVTTARELTADKSIESTVEVSAAGVYRRVGDRDPVPVLKLPAKVGDSWSPSQTAPGGLAAAASLTYTVGAADEEVEVPAGKFKCIRIDGAADLGGRTMKMTAWYAPGVGMVKTTTDTGAGGQERVVVLKAFQPGK